MIIECLLHCRGSRQPRVVLFSASSSLPQCSLPFVSVSAFSARYTWVKSVLDSFIKRLQAFSFSVAMGCSMSKGGLSSLRPGSRCHLHIPSPWACLCLKYGGFGLVDVHLVRILKQLPGSKCVNSTGDRLSPCGRGSCGHVSKSADIVELTGTKEPTTNVGCRLHAGT